VTSLTPHDLVARAASLYRRESRAWAADPALEPVLDVPLHPPAERDVLADVRGVLAWIDSWRQAEGNLPVSVAWGSRRWPSVGTQSVPERASVGGAEAVARVAGASGDWEVLRSRCAGLRAALGPLAPSELSLVPTLRRHGGDIAGLSARDFEVLDGVVSWLAAHPVSGRRVRELPIRGIDTKWLQRHRALVEALVSAVTGRPGLGLVASPPLVRLRVLDPALRIGGLSDVSAPVAQVAELALAPAAVLITENLETLLALPDRTGTVAIHGAGYAIDRLADIPWLAGRSLTYWGDLDSHGFAILHRARQAGLELASVLMNVDSLLAHRDLWVPEPQPAAGTFSTLTSAEHAALELLRAEGSPRLEQERIPWDYAMRTLTAALDALA